MLHQQSHAVPLADQLGVLISVGGAQRLLEGCRVAHVLEVRKGRLDQAVEVRADCGVPVRPGDLVDVIDVLPPDRNRIIRTRGPEKIER